MTTNRLRELLRNRALACILLLLLLSLSTSLGGCQSNTVVEAPASRLDAGRMTGHGGERFITEPTPSAFSICHGHTCTNIETVHLTTSQWGQIRETFGKPAATAAQEREQIRRTIAQLEKLIGALTGTSDDLGRNVAGFGKPGQLDCIDESTNSTVYLHLLAGDGLLKWHRVLNRTARGPLTGVITMPHSTAVIEDIDSGERYAIDSWFLANGHAPFAVPMSEWRRGWEPDQ